MKRLFYCLRIMMKTSNPRNKRFCVKGDIFYWPNRKQWLFFNDYFRGDYLFYGFYVFGDKAIEDCIVDKEKKKQILSRPCDITQLQRETLDKYWTDGTLRNPSYPELAKLLLMKLNF